MTHQVFIMQGTHQHFTMDYADATILTVGTRWPRAQYTFVASLLHWLTEHPLGGTT